MIAQEYLLRVDNCQTKQQRSNRTVKRDEIKAEDETYGPLPR